MDIFKKPNGSNFETSPANFLQYGNLRVVRAESAVLNAMSGSSGLLIKSTTDYLNNYSAGQGSSGEWGARTLVHIGTHLVCPCVQMQLDEQNLGSSNQTVGEDVGAT